MLDGCLIADWNNGCIKCVEGAIKNEYGQCDNKYINCLVISAYSQCSFCKLGYKLINSKCINNDVNCQTYEYISGLCSTCNPGYVLIGYRCVQLSEHQNCYIVA